MGIPNQMVCVFCGKTVVSLYGKSNFRKHVEACEKKREQLKQKKEKEDASRSDRDRQA
jgi:hypothetical protein